MSLGIGAGASNEEYTLTRTPVAQVQDLYEAVCEDKGAPPDPELKAADGKRCEIRARGEPVWQGD